MQESAKNCNKSLPTHRHRWAISPLVLKTHLKKIVFVTRPLLMYTKTQNNGVAIDSLSSCKTRKRRSLVTRDVPAAMISLSDPRFHSTVSFANESIITQVNSASFPYNVVAVITDCVNSQFENGLTSGTTCGPPVPIK